MNKHYVSMVDKFMSGWGMAAGKTNIMLVECDTADEAEAVARNAAKRNEMRKIKVHSGQQKPRFPQPVLVTEKLYSDLGPIWKE